MKKVFTTKVIIDVHPDGDLYIYDGKKFYYVGWLTDEEGDEFASITHKRAMRIFKKFKIKSPIK